MRAARTFLGRGWSFPPEFSKPSNPAMVPGAAMVEGIPEVEQSIRLILSTSPGERIMAPKFGCPLDDFLFRNVDLSMETLIRDRVKAALLKYEPRIRVDDVSIAATAPLEGRIELAIAYTVQATNSRHNFVYPYCQIEGTLLRLP